MKLVLKKEKLKKDEVLGKVAEATELKKSQVESVYVATSDLIQKEVADCKKVTIPHIGTFAPTHREWKARTMKSSLNGKEITIEAGSAYNVSFSPEKSLKDKVQKLMK